ncbi:DUF3278 domain-containing protein [Lentilactobacillus sp. IMAU92037]|uniref:DUF3278 domain-containing protein n=1 Tax=Lentilactobacillus TaxID=2767893 RepID=UPI001C2688FA|nr:DUF3278 domain-containing protein [Lentilactobacillus sp. TOM.63]MBU9789218.1 DUF3278 domain-containing protein [Lentilactobacillus dabitei]MBV0931370.1 DUF3278 domain-containing protein [Lentilactobacillus dabitei]
MKAQESFGIRMLKWFYGVPGPLDEYARQTLDRIGDHAFIFLSDLYVLRQLGDFWRGSCGINPCIPLGGRG